MPVGHVWDRKTKLKAKRLYGIDGLSPKEISKRTGVPVQTVSNWAWRYGWTRKRNEDETKALAQVEEQARVDIAAALESVAVRTEELVERGLDLAETAADSGDCKGFAMAAKGTQSLHAMWRQARGVDANTSPQNPASVTMIFNRFGEAEKPAQPVEVQAQNVSDETILEFDQSQEGSESCAASEQLIEKRA